MSGRQDESETHTREGLGVPDHAGLEDGLARDGLCGTKRLSLEPCAVLQDQPCLCTRSASNHCRRRESARAEKGESRERVSDA